ncbi:MAG: glycosyltransferase family 2 protein [Bacteroidota bacterium]|nr:glycosyltransferase family 2 protein [Bacteroidota bacterium]
MVSIIILTYNGLSLTRQLLNSLKKNVDIKNNEVIVVDNASTDNTVAELKKEYDWIQVIENEANIGFGAANNLAAKIARGEILLFLNNDVIVEDDFITQVVQKLSNDTIGALGPKILNPDHTFQLSAGRYPTVLNELEDKFVYKYYRRIGWLRKSVENKFSKEKLVDWITGASLFIKRKVFNEIGGFDEKYFMYFEDKDLCKRVRDLGYNVVYFPDVRIVHLLGQSSNIAQAEKLRRIYRESQRYYYLKHRNKIENFILNLYQNSFRKK